MVLIVLLIVPAFGAAANASTGNMTGGTGNTSLTAYEHAVTQAANPQSFEQAVVFFEALGGWLVVLALTPLLVVFVLGGIAGYWEEAAFWTIVLVAGVVAIVTVAITPYLLVSLH